METPQKIAARYIGNHAVLLQAGMGPYYDADGKRLTSLVLSYGDTLMMPAEEVLGKTYLRQGETLLSLGIGKVVLPENAHKSPEELAASNYEFHSGRSDFEPVVLSVLEPPVEEPAQAEEPPAPVEEPTPDTSSQPEQPAKDASQIEEVQ